MEEKKSVILPIIKGVVISYAMTIVLIALYSLILAKTNVSESTIPTCMIMICIVSILIGSSICNKKIKEKGLVNGGIVGFSYILVLYLLSSIFVTGFALSTYSLVMILFCVLAGILGGIVGVNMNS
ncbi:MAG: TIGR04086 family membrane protein [Clostridia bacterium]|nr:TIGR04086 family membrane protein [Clostridia bacterium]